MSAVRLAVHAIRWTCVAACLYGAGRLAWTWRTYGAPENETELWQSCVPAHVVWLLAVALTVYVFIYTRGWRDE